MTTQLNRRGGNMTTWQKGTRHAATPLHLDSLTDFGTIEMFYLLIYLHLSDKLKGFNWRPACKEEFQCPCLKAIFAYYINLKFYLLPLWMTSKTALHIINLCIMYARCCVRCRIQTLIPVFVASLTACRRLSYRGLKAIVNAQSIIRPAWHKDTGTNNTDLILW